LNATVDCDLTDLIQSSCSLSNSFKTVSECCERKHIALHVIRIKEKSISPLSWVIDGLVEFGIDAPKIFIFCRSVQLAGWVFEQILLNGKLSQDNVRRLVGMYHSTTLQHHKDECLQSLTNPGYPIRLVIAISALGCGVDMYIIHFGPSFDTIDYAQQIGRAGRATKRMNQCHAIMYVYPGSTRQITTNMKKFISDSNKKCLRIVLYSQFSSETISSLPPGHFCCSYCMKFCDCSEDNPKEYEIVREVSDFQKEAVKGCLFEYQKSFTNSELSVVPIDFVSGISEEVVDKILNMLPYISSLTFIVDNLDIISDGVAL